MHAVVRHGLLIGLVFLLTAPSGLARAGTAVVSAWDTAGVVEPGQPTPPVSLPSLSSEAGRVELADFRGEVVYLDFWSSWCALCRRSMPSLDALRQEFSREDFEVIGVDALSALVVDGAGVVREVLRGRALENRDALESLASAMLEELKQREVQ